MKRSSIRALLAALLLVVTFPGCGSESGDAMDFTTIDNGDKAIGALVQHASAQDEAYATLLEVFSQGFTLKLFDPAVELDGNSYDAIVAVQQKIVDTHDAYLRALDYIDSSRLLTATGALRFKDAGPALVKHGLFKSVKGFFWDWAYGNRKRSRDRILAASEGTSAETRQEMFDTAQEKFGDKVGASPDEMFNKLKNGELDKEAPQLHSNFATAVTDYGLECVDKKLTPTQVAAEEGAEGVKRGVDVVVDSSVAVVNAKFPGFAGGFQKGQDAVAKINKLHDKPVETIMGEVNDQARKWLVAKIGDKLGSTAATVAGLIAKNAGQYIKQKNRLEPAVTTPPAGTCRVQGVFGSKGSSTKPSDVKGIVMTGNQENTPAVVVNLGDPTQGNDPVIAPCGAYTVAVVGDVATQTQDLTVSEGTDAVIFVELGIGNPLADTLDPDAADADTSDPGAQDPGTPDSGATICAGGGFTLLDPSPNDTVCTYESGLVKDNTTGLVWMRKHHHVTAGMSQALASDYCGGKGMRLPTLDEALGIAGSHWNQCGWPCGWVTWTTTPSTTTGSAWYLDSSDRPPYELPVAVGADALCVR